MDGDDWDLAAIVRSCRCSKRKQHQDEEIAAAAAPPIVKIQAAGDQVKREEILFGFAGEHLERKPSFVDETLQVPSNPDSLKAAAVKNRTERTAASALQSSSPAKRRKKQLKKVVCQVPADGVSPDAWSWRKYGQKPIKGSPFPRGYYRCSTIRGCPARKQVERDRSNPGQLILTYTCTHRSTTTRCSPTTNWIRVRSHPLHRCPRTTMIRKRKRKKKERC